MDSNDGGPHSSSQHESAAEIARKKVLAVYSSTLESLKKSSANTNTSPYFQKRNGNQYITPPVPGVAYSDQEDFLVDDEHSDRAGNDYEQVHNRPNSETEPRISERPSGYQTGDQTSALKDLPVNQTAVNNEWQQYHSAWQNYYQNYYSEYYAKAAQNYLATEKLKSERIATGKVQRKRHIRKLIPLFAGIFVVLFFLFLQYNRLIFAPIMAYVSPDTGSVSTSISAVDPTVTQAVSPDPRLIIPKLNIDVPVAFDIPLSDVDSAMNHGVAQFSIPGANALPGQVGNLVLSGHSAGDIYSSNPYKFIFSGLERLEEGDLIYINYESVRYTYQMTKSEVVEPDNVAALIYATKKPILTLITCTPLGTSRYRLLITAEQISPTYDYNEGDGGFDGEVPTIPDQDVDDTQINMPANEPSFFENVWNSLFGGN